jgi:DNA-binding HxlR family transcriptional regulator
MERKIDGATRDKILDELIEKQVEFDDICNQVFFTLLAYEKLRFNQLLRTLKKLGIRITQPTLTEHLSHLTEKGLIEKEEGFQKASYSLREGINSVMHLSQEDLKEWLEVFHNGGNLPIHLRPLKITRKQLYSMLTDNEMDRMTVKDLADTLSLSLHELKTFIDYDLAIGKFESDAAFWKFVGNPLYRMHERSMVEKCRESERYRKLLFEKIDVLTGELRSDKQLPRDRDKKLLRE